MPVCVLDMVCVHVYGTLLSISKLPMVAASLLYDLYPRVSSSIVLLEDLNGGREVGRGLGGVCDHIKSNTHSIMYMYIHVGGPELCIGVYDLSTLKLYRKTIFAQLIFIIHFVAMQVYGVLV